MACRSLIERLLPIDGLTYDDVMLVPGYSETVPVDISVSTSIGGITLEIPIISSPMDTVTETATAIAVARDGGIGVIHRNLSPEQQAAQVEAVKRSEFGTIISPITLSPQSTVAEAKRVMDTRHISGILIVDEDGRLIGILTNRDIRFLKGDREQPVSNVMTQKVVTAQKGTTLEEAAAILQEHRIEKLPIVDEGGRVCGLITALDIKKRVDHAFATRDEHGRLRVGASIGASEDHRQRCELLVAAGVDLLVVDSAHAHSKRMLELVRFISGRYPQIPLMAGNVATADGTKALIDAGATIIRCGIGSSPICTTRVVSGAGVPQLTAVAVCVEAACDANVSVVADGGIQSSGDIAKAIGAGAAAVMIGTLLAGTDESPGETVLFEGRSWKLHRGMGSLGAIQDGLAGDRYEQGNVPATGKLVPEGIEGRVPLRGPVADTLFQLVGGLRAGMGYVGVSSVQELQEKARFIRVSPAAAAESHPHGVAITREAPNYPSSARR